jgi:hypothetical protein
MSVVSGIMGANAQEHAAEKNSNTADRGLALQEKLYNSEIDRNRPFYDAGVKGVIELDKMANGGYDIKESPSAKYQLAQGTKSLNRQLSARGLLGSGNASQRLAELETGVAANDFKDQWGRLLDQVKIGTGASAAAGASSQAFGQQVGQNSAAVQQNNTQAGAARASLYSGIGGAGVSAVNTGINAYRSGLFNNNSGGSYDAGGADFSGNTAGSGAVDNYGDPVGL